MRKAILALCLSCGAASSAQPPPPADAPAADFLETVRQMRAELMKPGPRVADWQGGADPSAAVRARGADRHVLVTEDENGSSVSMLTDRRIADVAPSAWRIVDSYGSPVAYAENPGLGFVPLGRRFVVASRSSQWREHGLDCGKGFTHAILFERRDADSKEDVETAIGMFRLTMLAMEEETLCTRAEGDPDKGWDIRVVLPDGRDLPAFNEGRRRMRIVPAGSLDALVKGTPLPDVPATGQ
jgi:hypothetical protein